MAHAWACVLVRPEYRQQIQDKFKTKIENIARKPINAATEQNKSPCPFCNSPVGDFELSCSECQNPIPYCIASGRHIVKEQVIFCRHCNFPANKDALDEALKTENSCPMCNEIMEMNQLEVLDVAANELRDWIR